MVKNFIKKWKVIVWVNHIKIKNKFFNRFENNLGGKKI